MAKISINPAKVAQIDAQRVKRLDRLVAEFGQLPVEVQVQFGAVMAQVTQFAQFDGWPAIYLLLTQIADQIPPDYQAVYQRMLAVAGPDG